ncbi:hypothetical protein GCM10023238_18850 [Streptomyces heliomycini]
MFFDGGEGGLRAWRCRRRDRAAPTWAPTRAAAPAGDCPHGVREGHRRAVAAFLLKRDEFAAGQGVPAAVAHSASASRQWVSEELTQAAEVVAERGRAEGAAWLVRLWRRTAGAVWAGVVLLLLGQALTAIGAGWTAARTAGLLAALVVAGALTAASWFHRARGGALAPVIGRTTGSPHPVRWPRAGCCSWRSRCSSWWGGSRPPPGTGSGTP